MDALAKLLSAPARSGVYHLNRPPDTVEKSAATAGLVAWRIDIGHVHGKQEFLQKLAKALEFPSWFGGNWDALVDCLTDLSWQPGGCPRDHQWSLETLAGRRAAHRKRARAHRPRARLRAGRRRMRVAARARA